MPLQTYLLRVSDMLASKQFLSSSLWAVFIAETSCQIKGTCEPNSQLICLGVAPAYPTWESGPKVKSMDVVPSDPGPHPASAAEREVLGEWGRSRCAARRLKAEATPQPQVLMVLAVSMRSAMETQQVSTWGQVGGCRRKRVGKGLPQGARPG